MISARYLVLLRLTLENLREKGISDEPGQVPPRVSPCTCLAADGMAKEVKATVLAFKEMTI